MAAFISCVLTGRKAALMAEFWTMDAHFLPPKLDVFAVFRLRGLCKKSKIDNHLAMKFINGSIVFMGLTGTMIHFSLSLLVPKWTLTVNLMKTAASTSAEETSFVLGKHSWSIHGDSGQCFGGDPYTKELKMSRCRDGEFTCSSGDCISSEERCELRENACFILKSSHTRNCSCKFKPSINSFNIYLNVLE